MKNTNTCPKCQSNDIKKVSAGYNAVLLNQWRPSSLIPFVRYVCADCGFSEEWIDDAEKLKKFKDFEARTIGKI